MGEVRAYSRRQRWTADEESVLIDAYPTVKSTDELRALFPDRSIIKIHCKANMLGLKRPQKEKRTREQILAAKREGMAQLRLRDPAAARRKRNDFHARNRDRQTQKMRDYYARRFFWGRAMKLRGPDRATANDLARIWHQQRGRCALTGERLDRSAQVDHKVPKTRGGRDVPANLQWISAKVNYAKRNLTDEEFISMCADVMAWIGQRIQMVEDIS